MTVSRSEALVERGTSEEFIAALCDDARRHVASHHPYLQVIAQGTLPDYAAALRTFAYEYGHYTVAFPEYMEAVCWRLQGSKHRFVLESNLREERGEADSDAVNVVPHKELFQAFARAVGVTSRYEAQAGPPTAADRWRTAFAQLCGSQRAEIGLGAIGIGTELLIPRVYSHLLDGLRKFTNLDEDQLWFFEMHASCDERHAAELVEISIDLATSVESRRALRFGALEALRLRAAFWDSMLATASSMHAVAVTD